MQTNARHFILFVFILIAAFISIVMQVGEVLGCRFNVTAAEDLRLETRSWRIIALITILISAAQYFLLRNKRNFLSWIGLLVSSLAIFFPLILGVVRVFQSFTHA